ncbi:MAG: hypothetical protein JNM70_09300 [Anaerolineae bacterium]|nr:hypothetical protein [Anaerolineae bacterium]
MNQNEWLLVGLGLCCVIPFVALLLASLWVIRNAANWLQPDTAQLQSSYEKLKAANASATDDQLVNKIIQRQALRSGIIGAITSVGGLPALPFGLTIDLYTTARIQSETLYFIAQVYSREGVRQQVLKLDEALTLRLGAGGNALLVEGGQRLGAYLIRRLVVIITEKTAAKVIPGIGLIIGFAVNYLMMQGMGRLAARWHKGRG